jgi:exopolysaccharide biosynthesis polyprenyl glycosylphosphotransferase
VSQIVLEPGAGAGTAAVLPPRGRAQRPGNKIALSRARAVRTKWLWGEAGAAAAVGLASTLAVTRQASGTWEVEVIGVVALLAWMVAVYHAGAAAATTLAPMSTPVVRHSSHVLAALMLPVTLGLVSRADAGAAAAAVVSAAAVTLVVRRVGKAVSGPVLVLLVGDARGVARLAQRWSASDAVQVAGVFVVHSPGSHDAAPDGLVGGFPVLSITEVVEQARLQEADAVLVADGMGFGAQDLRQLAWELRAAGFALGAASSAETIAPHRIRPARIAGLTVLDIAPAQRSDFVRAVKSAADRLMGAALLLLSAPVLGLLCLTIRLDSRGPAFFLQTRVGMGGRTFTMVKLRTMSTETEAIHAQLVNESDGVLFKIRQDPRVTRVGRFLRKASLDELPQLVNVVRGDMSLIGPRPALPAEVAQYDGDARRRLAVMPGLTGLWQVSGRSDLSWDESVRLDLDYVDNWRLVQDLSILRRTVGAVLRREGAY